ncbi:MAG: hypothetical protein IPM14_05240 [bacterium]|nr:hypothetical protein [bacterium]
MKFVSITHFAVLKKCSRETVYNAEKRGEVEIDRTAGVPVIHLTEKNMNWKPGQNMGRPKNKSVDIIKSEIKKEIEGRV